MTYYPRVSEGLNKLTAEYINRQAEHLQWFESNRRRIAFKRPERYVSRPLVAFPATIENRIETSDNRWSYGWRGVRWNGTSFEDTDRFGLAEGPDAARNLAEWNNTVAQGAYGQNLDFTIGSLIILPIPPGSIVMMFPQAASDGNLYLFNAQNATTPDCAE